MNRDPHKPTPRQQAILNFIRKHVEQRGFSPSYREIGEMFDISSPNGVACHLRALRRKGLLESVEGLSRTLRPAGHSTGSTALPLMGMVAAGSPRSAVELCEVAEFADLFSSGNICLRNDGDDPTRQLADGDFVVVRDGTPIGMIRFV